MILSAALLVALCSLMTISEAHPTQKYGRMYSILSKHEAFALDYCTAHLSSVDGEGPHSLENVLLSSTINPWFFLERGHRNRICGNFINRSPDRKPENTANLNMSAKIQDNYQRLPLTPGRARGVKKADRLEDKWAAYNGTHST